ncbi:hypothetical protein ACUN0C_10715 [Faunimonas sp. B44]|uniref:hypothetical protein n=1 Tax=Faunimonas sp. B44 TaxID=3461493 RepID=UPI004044B4B0
MIASARRCRRLLAAALALATLPAIAIPPAAAQAVAPGAPAVLDRDLFLPADQGWQVYVNARYGTSFAFPADVFTPSPPPENGDGRRFLAQDATLEIYAWTNAEREDASSLKTRLIGSEGYQDVTYSPSGESWLVLSGHRGDHIFYEKYFFRGETIHGFGMEFPAASKPRYAPIIERIEDSFRAQPPSG